MIYETFFVCLFVVVFFSLLFVLFVYLNNQQKLSNLTSASDSLLLLPDKDWAPYERCKSCSVPTGGSKTEPGVQFKRRYTTNGATRQVLEF